MLEFIKEEHLYLYEGVIIPSVSEILRFIFPNKYKDIPDYILQKASEHGTLVHDLCEKLDKGKKLEDLQEEYQFNYIVESSLKEHLRLKKKHNIKPKEMELMVCYKGLYAGRFDLIAEVDGELSLIDRKTTYELDKDYISWQLSFYELAYDKKFDKFYVEWLPKKGLGKLIEIKRIPKKQLIEKLEEYQEKEGIK